MQLKRSRLAIHFWPISSGLPACIYLHRYMLFTACVSLPWPLRFSEESHLRSIGRDDLPNPIFYPKGSYRFKTRDGLSSNGF
ncbi:hypothetical protein M0802_005536 [Mischocyttarus mexicanus]|nr:hypothetical protein M0802_005536 [Mischocyttarus mexicanus]